jgi:hypothetical protein
MEFMLMSKKIAFIASLQLSRKTVKKVIDNSINVPFAEGSL